MRFPIGSHVRLAGYTGDDQVDYYVGQSLEVSADLWHAEPSLVNSFYEQIQQYELTAPDGVVVICNADELEEAA